MEKSRDVILDCIDDATDEIESAKKHLEVAIRRAKQNGFPNLGESLQKHFDTLSAISNNLDECDI